MMRSTVITRSARWKCARHLSSKTLRPYQQRCVDEAAALFEAGSKRILFPIATGLGKTVLFAQLQAQLRRRMPDRVQRVLCLVHRDELLQQARAIFAAEAAGEIVGVEAADQAAPDDATIVVASVPTLGRKNSARLDKFEGFRGLVIVDEAHHMAVDNSYDRILKRLGIRAKRLKRAAHSPDDSDVPLLAGFTATPYRADGKDLMVFFDQTITPLDLIWGIRHGYLVDIKVVNVHTVTDLDGVRVRMREFSQGELGEAVNNHKRNSAIVQAIQQYGGRSCIAFCASVGHAHELAEVLRSAGIAAESVDGFIDKELRAARLAKFRSGEIQVLTNFGVLTEGVDVPSCDTVVMCRPTLSKALYMQMIGRGTRPMADVSSVDKNERLAAIRSSSKPRMVVIDIVDVCSRHDVVSMSSVLGLHRHFEWHGACVAGMADTLDQLLNSSSEETALELSEEMKQVRDLEELKMKVRTYRLLDRAASSKGAWLSHLTSLRPGDRIGYRHDKNAPAGSRDEHGQMCLPAIEVVVKRIAVLGVDEFELEQAAQDLQEQLAEASTAADRRTIKEQLKALAKSSKRTVTVTLQLLHATFPLTSPSPVPTFIWKASRIRGQDQEDDTDDFGGVHEGRAYSLQAVVDRVDSNGDSNEKVVHVTKCKLTPISSA